MLVNIIYWTKNQQTILSRSIKHTCTFLPRKSKQNASKAPCLKIFPQLKKSVTIPVSIRNTTDAHLNLYFPAFLRKTKPWQGSVSPSPHQNVIYSLLLPFVAPQLLENHWQRVPHKTTRPRGRHPRAAINQRQEVKSLPWREEKERERNNGDRKDREKRKGSQRRIRGRENEGARRFVNSSSVFLSRWVRRVTKSCRIFSIIEGNINSILPPPPPHLPTPADYPIPKYGHRHKTKRIITTTTNTTATSWPMNSSCRTVSKIEGKL